jgi:hypothetical protein
MSELASGHLFRDLGVSGSPANFETLQNLEDLYVAIPWTELEIIHVTNNLSWVRTLTHLITQAILWDRLYVSRLSCAITYFHHGCKWSYNSHLLTRYKLPIPQRS